MKLKIAVAAAAVALALAAPARRAGALELKFSTFVPPTHGFVTDVLEPLGKEIEKKSGGAVTVRVFAGNSPFGNVVNQADQVKQGVVDLAFGLNGIPRGRYLRSSIMEMPFVAESADLASRTLWAMRDGALAEDWKDFKLAALQCHNPGLFHTRDKRLETIYDVKGLRMRAPNPQTQDLLAYLGATPVGMPPGQVYENLEKGVIDGAVFPWDAIKGFRLESLLKYHLDARVYTACFHLVMNPQRFAAYPPAVQKAIDSSIGAPLVDKFGAWWNGWDKAGYDASMKAGGVLVPVSSAAREKWREQLQPVVDAQLAKLEKEGVPDARAIYDEMRKTEAKLAR
ncbi:MAG TPA: TRAP transporter substrate-binding protein [Burkholderiales bacterium]|nr:TRAP transporter substrate-binding protein [Burkholderiales bacterium]